MKCICFCTTTCLIRYCHNRHELQLFLFSFSAPPFLSNFKFYLNLIRNRCLCMRHFSPLPI
ncbi:hypothetical protein CW304_19280 [Bacillus sp. UFRGS-B20]|nr:hypothetical protein CW304_19280 [Bacillus sp. UFRGS-B20]